MSRSAPGPARKWWSPQFKTGRSSAAGVAASGADRPAITRLTDMAEIKRATPLLADS